MASTLSNPFSINGVLSTDKTVLENLNDLCTAASSWLTYDVTQGKWCVVINRLGTASIEFDDSNIIGNINISDTGINELYNAVSVEFPHVDLRDETDYVDLEIPSDELYPNENKNTLNLSINCINNPVQAQLLGSIELKQSRVAKIIEFRTDFSKLGLKAGDLINVTNEIYGFDQKTFRIVTIEEDDSDGVVLSITALEYDPSVYSSDGIVRTQRSKRTGIVLASQNEEIRNSNDVDVGNQMVRLLAANVGASLLSSLFKRVLGSNLFGPTDQTAADIDKIVSGVRRPTLNSISISDEVICAGDSVTVSVGYECASCLFVIPTLDYTYTITGVPSASIGIPLTGTVAVSPGSGGELVIPTTSLAGGTDTETFTIEIGGQSEFVTVQKPFDYFYTTTASATTIDEGESVTVTLTTVDIEEGTEIDYEITGTTDSVLSPLTGSVLIDASGQATITIDTEVIVGYTGDKTITVTFSPELEDPCGYLDRSVGIVISDLSPAPPPDTTSVFTEVPIVWEGVYDGATGQLKEIRPKKTARLHQARTGEASITVPLTVSVTQGSPSTVTVLTTAQVSGVAGVSGQEYSIITTFDSIQPNKSVTGTKQTVYGYF
jgi:hypothetical protein